ncbi:MAG: acyl-CoA dehydratase activase [Thermodesulfobacteriota bacterium]|nr:acyl-CoA dehydratase activase [Thermodesulfobacteriota bacterium]
MLSAGVDIGSITAKAVVMDDKEIIGSRVISTGYNARKAGEEVFNGLLEELSLGLSDIEHVISTGYGRNSVEFAHKAVTEILCHGAGAHFLNPGIRTIIDVGGQDSKALVVGADGMVRDFAMNDKCAAGTGRFLEVMAGALGADLNDFGAISMSADKPAKISSICTVFAESEVISLISKGELRENIIAGIHVSVASRIVSLAKKVGVIQPVMMTGGVAHNIGVVSALKDKLGVDIEVSRSAQTNGAIGAAILASRI